MNVIEWYKNTAWHKWWVENVWKPSWTKLTAAIYGIPAAFGVLAQSASTFLHDSTIQTYLAQYHIPNWVPVTVAVLALIHLVASGHDD